MALKLLQSFVSSVPILWCLSMLLLLYQASHKTALASTRLGGNKTDHLALLSIKAQITQDPMLITSSWNDSLHSAVERKSSQRAWFLIPIGGTYYSVKQFDKRNPSFFWEPLKSSAFHGWREHVGGNIPGSLGSLKGLRLLGLGINKLSGEIPAGEVFQNASAISVSGNNKLCGGIPALELPSCLDDQPRKKKMPLGLKDEKATFVASSSMDSWRIISYNKLLKATNGFSSANLIGTEALAQYIKGILNPSDEKAIAVKVFNQQRRGATKSFLAECKALKNIRHRNLVKIISACASVDFQANDFKALVYEYMENGSLEYWLHPVLSQIGHEQEQQKSLSLLQRLGIAIDVASALDYLHNHCPVLIVHCDIKPSNILLDGDMTSHVGDFGLARLLQQPDISELSNSQISSVGTKGTIGYVAPEYGMGNEVSTFGDVYSYGILLLELFTGKRPTDDMFIDGLDLHKLAKLALPERVVEIVDQNLLEEGSPPPFHKTSSSMKYVCN
ncbi:leucine-rich repeat protein kinase family protein [Actinidia rufa]|uniref:non-specific serine/threonine protein kinase n=1 Tax=Actinidia rufa TaxID=165716 RepID=A0A7J0F4J9_9ERIC|nr:leucine-rich repeat protein kinase family protein [Actinidia rufa]